jgi:hydrogenase-1 operon protein HyaF
MSSEIFDPNKIPAVNLFGPGSQPENAEDNYDYMPMPSGMSTFNQPVLPEPEELGDISEALTLLLRVVEGLENFTTSAANSLFCLDHLSANQTTMINQILGVGEVSVTIDGGAIVEVQESVMAGLWRIRHLDNSGQVVRDELEVGPIPSIVSQSAFQNAAQQVDLSIEGITGLINSPALLVELNDKVSNHQGGELPHVINLSLLPLSPEDLLLIGQRLGVGPVTILSRGYGNCRIGSTACNGVWWIKYYNSEDVLILNTIEVVDIPGVAIAAAEDIADSAHRLREILDIYQ